MYVLLTFLSPSLWVVGLRLWSARSPRSESGKVTRTETRIDPVSAAARCGGSAIPAMYSTMK